MSKLVIVSVAALAASSSSAFAQQQTSKLGFLWETWWWMLPLLLFAHFAPEWALKRYTENQRVGQPDWQPPRTLTTMKTLFGPIVVLLTVVPYLLFFRTS
jgi:hypothetical protein